MATSTSQRTTAQRGYGALHRKERARWKPVVDAGEAQCAEVVCLEELDGNDRWIEPGTRWDLAHDRDNPGQYRGPAHARCNRSEGGRAAHQQAPLRRWEL